MAADVGLLAGPVPGRVGGFADYRPRVGGLVPSPVPLSLEQLRALGQQSQIVKHNCIQGWTAIAEWAGVPLNTVMDLVHPPQRRATWCSTPRAERHRHDQHRHRHHGDVPAAGAAGVRAAGRRGTRYPGRPAREPAAGFGRAHLRELRRDDGGRGEGQVGELHMRWTGGAKADVHGESARSLRATLTVPEGSHHDLILELSGTALDGEPPDAARLWTGTETAWREAMPTLGASIAPHDARHSYAVLRGLTSSGGGHGRRGHHEPARTR